MFNKNYVLNNLQIIIFFKNLKFFQIILLIKILITYVYNYIEFSTLNLDTIFLNNLIWKIVFYLNNSNTNILIIMYLLYLNTTNNYKNIIIFVSFLFYINCACLYNLKYINYVSDSFLNKELYNGILIIHPILTYTAFVVYFILFLKKKHIWYRNNKIINLIKLNNLKIIFFFSCSIALILGSLWSQQELNWGGWWNWDSVEIVLLSLLLISLAIVHIDNKKVINELISVFYYNKYIYILLFYIIVRSNIFISVHSFSISSNLQKFFYSAIIFYIIIYLYLKLNFNLVLNFFYKNIKINYFLYYLNNIKNRSVLTLLFFIFNFLLIMIIIISVLLFILNKKINIDFFIYLNFLIKISFIYYFLKINKNNKLFLLILLVLFLKNIFIILTIILLYIWTEKKDFFLKNSHILIILTLILIIDDIFFEINFNKNLSLYSNFYFYINDFLISFNRILTNYKNVFYLNSYFLKNNLDFFQKNLFIDFFEKNLNSNFFNNNIINKNGGLIINFYVDNGFFIIIDFFLLTMLMIVVLIFVIFYSNFFKKRNFTFFKKKL